MCRPSHALGLDRTLVLSVTFCMRVSLGTKVDLRGCCGWLWRTSFVYVFCFGWLWRFSLKDSLCSSLICGHGGKFSFGIWVHMAWKPRSQHFISGWGQHTCGSHNSSTHTQPLFHAHTRLHTQTHTHALTHFRTSWPIRWKWSRSHQKWVGGMLKQKSVSGHTKFYMVWRTFLSLFFWFKKKRKNKQTLGSISAQLECGMAELLRIRKKRLQIPISR